MHFLMQPDEAYITRDEFAFDIDGQGRSLGQSRLNGCKMYLGEYAGQIVSSVPYCDEARVKGRYVNAMICDSSMMFLFSSMREMVASFAASFKVGSRLNDNRVMLLVSNDGYQTPAERLQDVGAFRLVRSCLACM